MLFSLKRDISAVVIGGVENLIFFRVPAYFHQIFAGISKMITKLHRSVYFASFFRKTEGSFSEKMPILDKSVLPFFLKSWQNIHFGAIRLSYLESPQKSDENKMVPKNICQKSAFFNPL